MSYQTSFHFDPTALLIIKKEVDNSIQQVETLTTENGIHIYFECDNLDKYVSELLDKGIEFDEMPNDKSWLWREAHLKDIDKKGENDLAIENGDFVIEDGDLKLTGYQSRLHYLSIWLHMEVCKKLTEVNPMRFVEKMEDFEKNYLEKPNYTPEYKAKLDKIIKSLKQERKLNLGEKENFWSKIFDLDNLELKPNIAGIGINGNNLIDKFRKP